MFITLKIFRIKWEEKARDRIELPTKVVLEIDVDKNINNQIQDFLFDSYNYSAEKYEIQGYSVEANYALQMQLNEKYYTPYRNKTN